MNKISFNLLAEPRDDVYRKLIEYSASHCRFALLVVRHSLSLTPRAEKVLGQLAIALNHQAESSEWPGTKLLNDTALVLKYNLGPDCTRILKESADALYDWQQPELPEDLCLLRDDGEPWLVSIAHESDGFLCLSQEESRDLFAALPAIESLVEKGAD